MTERKNLRRVGVLGTGALALATAFGMGQVNAPTRVSAEGSGPSPITLGGSETPSPVASASPEASASSVNYSEPGHFATGDRATVKAGDLVIGDVYMADFGTTDVQQFSRLFDTDTNKQAGVDNAITGLITEAKVDAEVYFPYGGDTIRLEEDKKADWLSLQAATMEASGCDNGCTDGVNEVFWTGRDTTVTQSGSLAKDTVVGGSDLPSGSPEPTVAPSEAPTSTFTLPEDLSTLTDRQIEEDILKELDAIRNCTCNGDCAHKTPGPSASPTPTPTPTSCPNAGDNPMQIGDRLVVEAGEIAIVQADATIDGVRRYDSLGETGSIDVLADGKRHVIQTKVGGGDVIIYCPTTPLDQIRAKYDSVKQALLNGGRTLDKNSINELN